MCGGYEDYIEEMNSGDDSDYDRFDGFGDPGCGDEYEGCFDCDEVGEPCDDCAAHADFLRDTAKEDEAGCTDYNEEVPF